MAPKEGLTSTSVIFWYREEPDLTNRVLIGYGKGVKDDLGTQQSFLLDVRDKIDFLIRKNAKILRDRIPEKELFY